MPVIFDIVVRTQARTHIMAFVNLDEDAAQRVLVYFKGWESLPEPIARRAKKAQAKPKKQTEKAN